MKTKTLLIIFFLGVFSLSGFSQNQAVMADENTPAKPHTFLPTDLSSVTTTDNENNALTGTPDYDMDTYLFDGDPGTPIEFNIFIDDPVVTIAQLSILAWDVDWVGHSGWLGELDRVYINGHYIGYLTGANDEWSTSVFFIDPTWVNAGPAGKNLIQIEIDERGEGWAVQVDWGQLIINGAAGVAEFRYVTTDKTNYVAGETVVISEEVDADPSLYVRVETDLLDPDGLIIAGTDRLLTATMGDEPFTESLTIPPGSADGFYQVMAILYDVGTSTQQDIEFVPFIVGNPCVDPTYGGEIGNAQSNCGGFDPAPITSIALPTGHYGTLEYMWMYSLDNITYFYVGASNYATLDPPPITQTTYFIRFARADCSPDWTGAASSNVVEMTVHPVPTVDAGADEQIYIGYPPYDVQLNAVGSWAGSYLWSPATGLDDASIANPIAMPATTTTYTVTFTDANGCTATDDVVVNVMDVRCGHHMDKVLVCHIPPDNPDNPHTICIAFEAVAEHLSHGDYLGECIDDKVLDVTSIPEETSVLVFPNPMENNCTIELNLNHASPVEIYITDITGKRLNTIFKGELEASHYHYSWTNMNNTKGIYFLTVTTNYETITKKLLVK
ncbi:MAG: T9SS type A sorting domain-containing protein [Bacteroidota bacterium]